MQNSDFQSIFSLIGNQLNLSKTFLSKAELLYLSFLLGMIFKALYFLNMCPFLSALLVILVRDLEKIKIPFWTVVIVVP